MSKNTMKNGDQTAFPAPINESTHFGLTKREWFAGLAMQGILANTFMGQEEPSDESLVIRPEDVGYNAVKYADAIIAALASTEDTGGTA